MGLESSRDLPELPAPHSVVFTTSRWIWTGANSAMEYKKTLNLPRTHFPMRANLPVREPERLAVWEAEGLYERMLAARADAPLFLLHDGPPYANGNIHIGHALNKILKDIVLKYRALAGFRTPYRPGWDCHGLPIELEVEKKVGRSKKAAMSLVEVRGLCRDYADRFVGVQRDDFRRLGVLGEWDRPYLTKDFDFEATEARELGALFDTGAVYRSRKPVQWCASCRTALAEAEVDYENDTSLSVYVAFEVAFEVAEPSGPLAEHADRRPAVAIWTTTPWTLPANMAIAVSPHFDYALVECGERSLVLAADLVEGLREKLGLGAEIARFSGRELEAVQTRHPWIDRASPVILGDHVTLEAGTGCVHTAPGHGQDDYLVGRKYDLEVYAPVDAGGIFTDEVPEFAGRFVFTCDDEIAAMLTERGALLASEPFQHPYPHCWRCKKAIIFRATEQWFVSMDASGLRARALEEIDKVHWIPAWGRDRIRGMIASRPDWCLSRQRAWGVPIIALHCNGCGHVEVSGDLARHVADIFEHEGADAWFARSLEELLPDGFACSGCGGHDFDRETDILDVWFDSGVSFAAVVEADHGKDVRADLYLEGSDQHRGWFHSALLASVANRDRAPYAAVLTHGFVLDGKGRKMSKSEGNVVAPQDVLKQFGADILRLWVAAEDFRDDVKMSKDILAQIADSYRRIRNTSRNLLGNLSDFDPALHTVAPADMSALDRWILTRLASFVDRCAKGYEEYEFRAVFSALVNFCSVDLSSLYFDILKDRLYCSPADAQLRRSAQSAMYEVLSALARIIAPIACFTADEIWEAMPVRPTPDPSDGRPTVFLAGMPQVASAWRDEELAKRFERLLEIRAVATRALEEKRQAGDIGGSLEAGVRLQVSGADAALIQTFSIADLEEIFIVSKIEIDVVDQGEPSAEVTAPTGTKCARCWKFAETVGSGAQWDDLCVRCHGAVEMLGELPQ
ncbi:MAG: isoleucyl-tRNA synthetase [Hyphomicrobiaceae bacterium]|jgi:isoleucyl-tRNA synthetase